MDVVLKQTLEDYECKCLLEYLLQDPDFKDKQWDTQILQQGNGRKEIQGDRKGTQKKSLRYEFDSNRGIYHFYDMRQNEHVASYRISELSNMNVGYSIYRRPLSWRLRMGIKHICNHNI